MNKIDQHPSNEKFTPDTAKAETFGDYVQKNIDL